jgi:hypothetical protein
VHSFVLADWTSAAGPTGSSFTQDESGWLDLSPFQDVVIYLTVSEVSATPPTIAFETSPCREDALFQPMTSMTMSSTGPQPSVLRAVMLGSTVPLARYLRWKITAGGAAWDATFRALVAANSPGM